MLERRAVAKAAVEPIFGDIDPDKEIIDFLNTNILAPMFPGSPPLQVASAAGVIGGSVYLIALVAIFFLPAPHAEVEKQAVAFGSDEALKESQVQTID